MTAQRGLWAAFALLAGSMAAGPVHAQQEEKAQQQQEKKDEEKKDDTLDKAGSIASQPVRDVGIARTKIPPLLDETAKNPYAPPSSRKCAAILADIGALNEILGQDFSANEQENENRAGKIAEASGKMIVNSLIPFRGLVREVTGAAPAERRLQAAVSAGIARRGYLRGLAESRRCKLPET